MQIIVGILILLASAWVIFINLIPLIQQIRMDRVLTSQNGQDESLAHASMAMKEHFTSMLLMSVGAAIVVSFFVLAGKLTLINMLSSGVAWHGYGSIIQYFRKYDTAAQVARRGGDVTEFHKTLRFTLILGLVLLTVGAYFALRGVLFGA